MKDKFLQQARREYSPRQRMLALACLAPIFLFLIPYALISLGSGLDRWLGWSPILGAPANLLFGILLIVPGLALGLWSNESLFTIGRGTPVPLMATQKLVVQPPYTYCRNPMALGAIIAYVGVALLFRSPGALLIILVVATLLLLYIKRTEEQEMALRFGAEYLAYKARTPFLIPRLWKHH